VERRVADIAAGAFAPQSPRESAAPVRDEGPDDEIGRLVGGVERMSEQLGTLRARLVAGERERLLGQLAAGFAHELRNALTGARLAIDLHRSRCPGSPDDGSLDVARRQLAVIEEEVRGLLALSRRTESAPAPVPLAELLAEVADLVSPRSRHAGTALVVEPAGGTVIVVRRDALRAALVNLACNALEAAGPGGHVRLAAVCGPDGVRLRVEDDGPGPPEHLAATIHEPFVTGKPEGIGLGLAIVKAVAEEHGGRLEWNHADGRTRFEILLPAAVAALLPAPSAAVPLP
ncbi:MAG: sensor histidine kinase, partial [Planctomycetaceae bacterium]